MKATELAYLAGLVDAECHVGLQRDAKPPRRTPTYVTRFELAMTTESVVNYVASILPWAKVVRCGRRGRRLPYFRVRVGHQRALWLLRKTLPFLQGKRRQVEICLEIERLRRAHSPSRRHRGQQRFAPMPAAFEAAAKPLFLEFRSLQLNKKPRR